MRPHHLPLLLIALLFAACKNPAGTALPVLSPFKGTAADSIYGSARPKVQHFTIDGGVAKTITAAAGTTILFPAGCFLNAASETISGPVQVEVVEALALKDFISGGLATVSDGKLLLSNGMLYLNATANGRQLQPDTANPPVVTLPGMGAGGNFEMFTGDGSNWQPDSSMTEKDFVVTLPLDLLYPEGNRFFWRCIYDVGGANEKYLLYDTAVCNVENKAFENTVIATREFKQRYSALHAMMQWMSYLLYENDLAQVSECERGLHNYDVFEVYFQNPMRSFRESDSIAKQLYISYFKTNEKKLEKFCAAANKFYQVHYSNWTDTNYYFDFRKQSLEQQYMGVLTIFPPKNTKAFKQFNVPGVNITDSNARQLLLQKGMAVKDINEMLSYHYYRNAVINLLKAEKESRKDYTKLQQLYSTTVFSVTKMGWINCDRFYDDPDAGKAEIFVSNGSGTPLRFIDCSLVIPSMNVRLTAWQQDDGRYTFTQKDGRYIKLPIGKQALVVGTSLQDNTLYFAAQKITIKDGITVNLPMKQMAAASLPDSLQAVLKQ